MEVRHVVRWQQYGIVLCIIQLAVCAIDYTRFRQRDSTLRLEIRNHELMTISFRGLVTQVVLRDNSSCFHRQRSQKQQNQPFRYFHADLSRWIRTSTRGFTSPGAAILAPKFSPGATVPLPVRKNGALGLSCGNPDCRPATRWGAV